MDDQDAKDRDGKPAARPRWGCVITILSVTILWYLGHRFVNPSDWVDLTVGPLPESNDFFCVVVEDSSGFGTLPWYHSKVFPFTMEPFEDGSPQGGFWDPDHDHFITASVQWREGRRYGILIQFPDGQWRLWWLKPGQMTRPSISRHLFGVVPAEMHLPPGDRAEIPSKDFLKRLGWEEPRQRPR